MATFRVTYTYRKFADCPLATFVDKYTHHPLVASFLGMLLGFLLMLLGVPFYNASHGNGFLAVVSYVFILIGFIVFLLGGWIISKLSDKMDWAGKIAAKQREKQQR